MNYGEMRRSGKQVVIDHLILAGAEDSSLFIHMLQHPESTVNFRISLEGQHLEVSKSAAVRRRSRRR